MSGGALWELPGGTSAPLHACSGTGSYLDLTVGHSPTCQPLGGWVPLPPEPRHGELPGVLLERWKAWLPERAPTAWPAGAGSGKEGLEPQWQAGRRCEHGQQLSCRLTVTLLGLAVKGVMKFVRFPSVRGTHFGVFLLERRVIKFCPLFQYSHKRQFYGGTLIPPKWGGKTPCSSLLCLQSDWNVSGFDGSCQKNLWSVHVFWGRWCRIH